MPSYYDPRSGESMGLRSKAKGGSMGTLSFGDSTNLATRSQRYVPGASEKKREIPQFRYGSGSTFPSTKKAPVRRAPPAQNRAPGGGMGSLVGRGGMSQMERAWRE